jgi:hypothetical protein
MKKLLSIFFVILSVICTSCGVSSESSQEVLRDVDVNSDKLQMTLDDMIQVNAQITPYDKYKDGLNSYYLEPFLDNDGKKYSKYTKDNVILCNQNLNKALELIQDNALGNFRKNKTKIESDESDLSVKIPFSGNRKGMGLKLDWMFNAEQKLSGVEIYFDTNGGSNYNYATVGRHVITTEPLYKKQDFSFMASEAVGEKCLSLTEKITGQEFSEDYIVVPVTEEMYTKVAEDGMINCGEYPGEYYVSVLYRSVDGFPWKGLQMNIKQKTDDVTLDSWVEENSDGTLGCRDEWATYIAYNKDGIMDMESDVCLQQGDIYKKETVCDVNRILKNIKEYYENVMLTDTITVYDISIAYSSYFTDGENGVIKNAVRPFWVASICDDDGKAVRLIFDISTGKFLDISGIIT